MKLLVFILNNVNRLDDILAEFALHGICGATVVNSEGMARILTNSNLESELPYLGTLRHFFNPEHRKGKMILTVINEEKVEEAVNIIESIVGDLSRKDTGIVFSLSIDYVKGLLDCGKYNNR